MDADALVNVSGVKFNSGVLDVLPSDCYIIYNSKLDPAPNPSFGPTFLFPIIDSDASESVTVSPGCKAMGVEPPSLQASTDFTWIFMNGSQVRVLMLRVHLVALVFCQCVPLIASNWTAP